MTVDPKEPEDIHDAEFEVTGESHTQLAERPSIDVNVPEPEPDEPPSPPPPVTADVLRWRKLVELRQLVSVDQADVDAKAALLKQAKANLEESTLTLLRFIDDESRQPSLPFPEAGPAEGEVATGPAPGDGDESWRAEPLAAVLQGFLKDRPIEALADAGLATVGDLAAYTASGKRLTDIDGIGPAKAELIDRATESFWTKWRQRKGGAA